MRVKRRFGTGAGSDVNKGEEREEEEEEGEEEGGGYSVNVVLSRAWCWRAAQPSVARRLDQLFGPQNMRGSVDDQIKKPRQWSAPKHVINRMGAYTHRM